MRFLLPLFLALSAWAQPDPIWKKLIAVPSTVGIGHDPDLKCWWDASDLPTQAVTNWIDKISGVVATNGNTSRRPAGAPTGVIFTNASSQSLTNLPISLSGNQTIQIVCLVSNAPAFMGILSGGGGSIPEILFNNRKPESFFQGLYNVTAPTAMTANTVFDVILTAGVSPGLGDIYTNGILAIHQTTAFQFNSITNIGTGADGFFNGVIKEIRIWTSVFDSTRVATNHTWETNKWGYSP